MIMDGLHDYIDSSTMPDVLKLPVYDVPSGRTDEDGNVVYMASPLYFGRGEKDMWMMDYRKFQAFNVEFKKNRVIAGQLLLSMLGPSVKSRLKKRFNMDGKLAKELAESEDFKHHQGMEPMEYTWSLVAALGKGFIISVIIELKTMWQKQKTTDIITKRIL